ncbi:MAG: helix-turn-helix transcriptional regulator [Flavobacteriaceae bacterium]|nr:helix-turn-helix transcriptional regulator [Flavobacteriaceae bacterium]
MKFGRNIKKIRSIKKLSQTAFAEIFALKRSSIGAYEEERAEPKLETIIKIATHFNISIDQLITHNITVNELVNFNLPGELSQKNKKTSEDGLSSIALTKTTQLLLKSLEQLILKPEEKIRLPNLKEHHLAIQIASSSFEHIPDTIQTKDLIIIDSKHTLNQAKGIENRCYILKHQQKLSIGDIKRINEHEIILFDKQQRPIYFKINELDFIAPIATHISNSPKTRLSESSQIRRLEFLVNDLYTRI